MGYLLLAVRNKLRANFDVTYPDLESTNWVGVEVDGIPPARAPEWYVAIDEGDIRSQRTEDQLQEEYSVEIYVCRRPDRTPSDFQRQLSLPTDLYLASILTLEKLERQVIKSLHNNQTLRGNANSLGGFPNPNTGDIYQLPLQFDGRSKSRTEEFPDSGIWMRRQLRFSGMLRVQDLSTAG
jgi:hypothetical protein